MAIFRSEFVKVNGTRAQVREKLTHPELLGDIVEKMRGTAGELSPKVADAIDKIQFGEGTISIQAGPVGTITFLLIDDDNPDVVTYSAQGSPVPLKVMVEVRPQGDLAEACTLIDAQIPVFMKGMVAKPMQQAVDMFADLLKKIPSWA